MRPIDEAEAIKNIEQFCDIPRYAKDEAEQRIRETNTIDAVPVVHCGECKYLETLYAGGTAIGHCDLGERETLGCKPDDFCSYGERKDGME